MFYHLTIFLHLDYLCKILRCLPLLLLCYKDIYDLSLDDAFSIGARASMKAIKVRPASAGPAIEMHLL